MASTCWASRLDDLLKSCRVNARGVLSRTRCAARLMAEQKCGRIVNIGSIQGVVGPDPKLYDDPSQYPLPDYFYHKGDLTQMTRYAAAILGSRVCGQHSH